jgi:hypothetical protein
MLNDQYSTMNPIGNNILLAYLENYGSSYAGNNNIPNPWTIIPNLYDATPTPWGTPDMSPK